MIYISDGDGIRSIATRRRPRLSCLRKPSTPLFTSPLSCQRLFSPTSSNCLEKQFLHMDSFVAGLHILSAALLHMLSAGLSLAFYAHAICRSLSRFLCTCYLQVPLSLSTWTCLGFPWSLLTRLPTLPLALPCILTISCLVFPRFPLSFCLSFTRFLSCTLSSIQTLLAPFSLSARAG